MRLGRTAIFILLLAHMATGASAQTTPLRQRHNVTQQEREQARADLDAFTSPTLTRFRDEAEFRRYIDAVRAADRTGAPPPDRRTRPSRPRALRSG